MFNDLPGAGFADFDPRPVQILLQPLIVLCQTAQLQLAHGLLVRTRGAHRGILDSNEGYDWYAFGLGGVFGLVVGPKDGE